MGVAAEYRGIRIKEKGRGEKPLNPAQVSQQAWRYILNIDEKLIANVGGSVWVCLLAMYSSRHPVFLIALASTTFFGLLNRHLSRKVLDWKFKGSNAHFVNAITTCVHAALASLISYSSVYAEWDEVYTDLRQNSSPLSVSCVGIAVGYFAYDLWHIVHAGMARQSPALMVHHLAIMAIYSLVIVESQFYPYMVLTLLCEPHSLTMQLRKVAKVAFNVPAGIVSNALLGHFYWGLWMVNFLTCGVTRMGVHGLILYNVYVARGDTAMFPERWMSNCALGGMLLINAINFGLFLNIYKAYQKDKKLVLQCVVKKADGMDSTAR